MTPLDWGLVGVGAGFLIASAIGAVVVYRVVIKPIIDEWNQRD